MSRNNHERLEPYLAVVVQNSSAVSSPNGVSHDPDIDLSMMVHALEQRINTYIRKCIPLDQLKRKPYYAKLKDIEKRLNAVHQMSDFGELLSLNRISSKDKKTLDIVLKENNISYDRVDGVTVIVDDKEVLKDQYRMINMMFKGLQPEHIEAYPKKNQKPILKRKFKTSDARYELMFDSSSKKWEYVPMGKKQDAHRTLEQVKEIIKRL